MHEIIREDITFETWFASVITPNMLQFDSFADLLQNVFIFGLFLRLVYKLSQENQLYRRIVILGPQNTHHSLDFCL